jgi:hypothetical protein
MLGAYSLASRPLVSSARLPRPFTVDAVGGEFGWASWSYSRQAKLNAWTWNGIGALGAINSWATLGNVIYVRDETDTYIYAMQADVFFADGETNSESTTVEATTQWLDFGKPGKKKALAGMDFDGKDITAVEIYVSENGGRDGVLAASIAVSDNDGGWTYNGELIPLEEVGSATEFMLRFIGDPDVEVQINRVTLWYDEVAG